MGCLSVGVERDRIVGCPGDVNVLAEEERCKPLRKKVIARPGLIYAPCMDGHIHQQRQRPNWEALN